MDGHAFRHDVLLAIELGEFVVVHHAGAVDAQGGVHQPFAVLGHMPPQLLGPLLQPRDVAGHEHEVVPLLGELAGVGPADASAAAGGDYNGDTTAWWCPWRQAVPDNDVDDKSCGVDNCVVFHASYHSRISTPPAFPAEPPTVIEPP